MMHDDMLREFYDIGKSLSSEKDTLKLFEKIINSSMKLTCADAGTIYLVVDQKSGSWSYVKNGSYRGKLLKFIISRNASIEVDLEHHTSPITKKSIFGFTVISGNSLRIDDAYRIPSDVEYMHNRSFDASTGYVTKSILSIPMKNYDNNVTGVIQLINKKKSTQTRIDYADKDQINEIIPFDQNDELIMNSLAGQAAVALDNNLLYRSLQDLLVDYRQQNSHLLFLSKKIMKAHEEERKRIAREIHDGPAQSAANLALKLEICKKFLERGDKDGLSSEMSNLNLLIHSTVKEIRTIIYDLKPSCLENGLISSVQSHICTFSENTGINIDFKHSGDDSSVEYYLTSTLYRIVQEALTNVKKHAEAKNIKIGLFITGEKVTLSIADDGKGFDVAELKYKNIDKLKGGFGLEGIRERVELVKGHMNIDSAVGKGSIISVSIPIK